MKVLRNAVVVIVVAVAVAFFAGTSFAAGKGQHKDWQAACQAKIKVLKDSAAALQQANPDLAKGLNDLAAEKEKKMQEMTDMKAKHDAKTKLLKDSAAALKKTNPDMAKEISDMCEYKHMGKMGMWSEKKKCSPDMMGHEEDREDIDD